MVIMPRHEFFEEHMQYIAARDMVGMVTNTYTEDAIWYNPFPCFDIPPLNVIQGREKLIKCFNAFLEYQGDIQLSSFYNFLETEDVISFQTTIKSSNTGEWAVGDIWLMSNHKIARHFAFAHKLGNN